MRKWELVRYPFEYTLRCDGKTVAWDISRGNKELAEFIVDALNAAEGGLNLEQGVIADSHGPVFTVRDGMLCPAPGVGIEITREKSK